MECNIHRAEELSTQYLQNKVNSGILKQVNKIAIQKINVFRDLFGNMPNSFSVIQPNANGFRAEWRIIRDLAPMTTIMANNTRLTETSVLYKLKDINKVGEKIGKEWLMAEDVLVRTQRNHKLNTPGVLIGIVDTTINNNEHTLKYIVNLKNRAADKAKIVYVNEKDIGIDTNTKVNDKKILSINWLDKVKGYTDTDIDINTNTVEDEQVLQEMLSNYIDNNYNLSTEGFKRLEQNNIIKFENDKNSKAIVNIVNNGNLKVWIYSKTDKTKNNYHKLLNVIESDYIINDKIVLNKKWKNGEIIIDKYATVEVADNKSYPIFNTKRNKNRFRHTKFNQKDYKESITITNNNLEDIAKSLQEESETTLTEEHKNHLLGLMHKLTTAKVVNDTDLYLNKHSTKNGIVNGFYNYVAKKDIKAGIYITDSGITNTDGDMSLLETFTHEILHTIEKTGLSIVTPKTVKIRREIEKLREFVMSKYDYKILLGKNASKNEIKKAKNTWKYMVGKNGLHEFIALGLTNNKLVEKLKTIPYKDIHNDNITSVFGKLLQIFADTLDAITAVLKGETQLKNKDSYEVLLHMNIELGKISKETTDNSTKKRLNNLRIMLDKKVSNGLKKLLQAKQLDTFEYESIVNKPTWLKSFYLITKINRLLALGDIGKGTLYSILDSIGFSTEGAVQTLLRNFITPDDLSSTVEKLGLLSANIDAQRAQTIKDITANIKKDLGPDIPRKTEEELSKVLVMSDLQSLLTKFDINQIIEILSDDNKIDTKINEYTKKVFNKNSKESNYIYNQIKGLAYYMYSGKGNEAQLPNAKAIVDGVGLSTYKKDKNLELTKDVDILISLKALKLFKKDIDTNTIEYINNNKKAVESILSAMKYHEENFSKELFNSDSYNRIKGRTAEIANSNIDIKIGLVKDEKKFKDKGYIKVKEMNSKINKDKIAIYINKFPTEQTFTKQALRLTDSNKRGTDIETMISNSYDKDSKEIMLAEFRNKLESITNDKWLSDSTVYRKMINEMSKEAKKVYEQTRKKLISEYYKDSKAFDRVSANEGLMPTFKVNGKVDTYRLQMGRELKEDLLNLDTRVSRLIGHTYGKTMDITETIKQNSKTVDTLEKDSRNNYVIGNKFGKNKFEYILIKPSTNSESDNIGYWEMLPYYTKKRFKKIALHTYNQALKKYIPKELSKNSVKYKRLAANLKLKYYGVPIRKDLTRYYLGGRALSVTNTKLVKSLPLAVQTNIARAGAIWTDIVQIAKTNIIAKLPQVVIGNAISNTVLMTQYGVPIIQVVSLPAKGVSELHKYRLNIKKIRDIDIKLKTANKNTVVKLNNIKERLLNENKENSVDFMIRNGGFLGLVEELAEEDDVYRNHLVSVFHKLTNKLPDTAQTIINYLTLNSKTAPFQFMEKAIQEHDFATSYAIFTTLYTNKLLEFEKTKGSRASIVEKNKIKKEVFLTSKIATILYNKLDEEHIKYLNDIGLVIFTKFAIGANRVIKELTTEHPVSSALSMIPQFFLPMDDMLDHSFLETNWVNLVNTPADILDSAFYTIFELPADVKRSF